MYLGESSFIGGRARSATILTLIINIVILEGWSNRWLVSNLGLLEKLIEQSLLLGSLDVISNQPGTERELSLELWVVGSLSLYLISGQNKVLDLLWSQRRVELLINSSLISHLELSLVLLEHNVFALRRRVCSIVDTSDRVNNFLGVDQSLSILLLFFGSLGLLSPDGISDLPLLLLLVGCHLIIHIFLKLSCSFSSEFVKLEFKCGTSVLLGYSFSLMLLLLEKSFLLDNRKDTLFLFWG